MKRHLKSIHKSTVINPMGYFMERWDIATLLALMFTALFAPFEVAFLQFEMEMMFNTKFILQNILWFVNRVVDCIFLTDILVNFFLSYRMSVKDGGEWVKSNSKIVKHYLTTWFPIDIVSVIPFDLIGLLSGSDDIKNLKSVRLIRLLRLLKLVRILKASRMFTRWESKIGTSYGVLSLIKFLVMGFVTAHWIACVWGIAPQLQDDYSESWMGLWEKDKLDGGVEVTYADKYWACLYVSLLAIGSGVGNITPVNTLETVTFNVMLILGSSMWAYIIGSICGVIATLDPHGTEFKQTMDQLNFFMSDKLLPQPLRVQLREYFNQTKHLMKAQKYGVLLDGMSMELKGKVAFELADQDLLNVWYFKDDCDSNFLMAISLSMTLSLFASRELVSSDCLRIVVRGLAGKAGKVVTAGHVFGEDCIVQREMLRDLNPAVALTFLEVMSIEGDDMMAIAAFYPKELKKLHKAASKMAFIRAVKIVAKADGVKDKNSCRHIDVASLVTCDGNALDKLQGMVTLQEAVDERKQNEISTISSSMDSVRGTQTSLESKVAQLGTSVASMEGKLADTNSKLDALLTAITTVNM